MVSLFEKFMQNVEESCCKKCKKKKCESCENFQRIEKIRNEMKNEECFGEFPDTEDELDEPEYPFLKMYDDGLAVIRNMKKKDHWKEISDATYKGMPVDQRVQALQIYYEDRNPFSEGEQITEEDVRGLYGRTQLHIAVLDEDLEEMKELVEGGANTNLKDNNGYSPYLLGVLEGKVKAIKLFKKLGIMK